MDSSSDTRGFGAVASGLAVTYLDYHVVDPSEAVGYILVNLADSFACIPHRMCLRETASPPTARFSLSI